MNNLIDTLASVCYICSMRKEKALQAYEHVCIQARRGPPGTPVQGILHDNVQI